MHFSISERDLRDLHNNNKHLGNIMHIYSICMYRYNKRRTAIRAYCCEMYICNSNSGAAVPETSKLTISWSVFYEYIYFAPISFDSLKSTTTLNSFSNIRFHTENTAIEWHCDFEYRRHHIGRQPFRFSPRFSLSRVLDWKQTTKTTTKTATDIRNYTCIMTVA